MLLKSLTLAVAGLAASSAAFLLPPEVSESDVAVAEALPFEAVDTVRSQVISLDCPGCPVQVQNREGRVRTKNGKHSHLELTFTIDGESGDRLLVNDFELYPNSDPFHNVLTVPQVWDRKKDESSSSNGNSENELKAKKDKSKSLKSHHKGMMGHGPRKIVPPRLGFSLQIHPEAKDKEQQFELIGLDLQIIEVGYAFVDGIPNVHIKLIKHASGALRIASIETTTSQTLPATTPMDKQEDECTTFLCRWLSLVRDRLASLRSKHCGKGKNNNNNKDGDDDNKKAVDVAELADEQQQQDEEEERPHGWGFHHHHHHPHPFGMHHGHHGPHGHHMGGYHRSWAHLLRNITSHILLPILIGVLAGVTVSLIGMVVGTAVVALWRTFFRRHSSHRRPGHAHHKAAQKEAAVAEEKSGLMADQEAPPSYEENHAAAAELEEEQIDVKKTDVEA